MTYRVAHVITHLRLGGAQEWTLVCAQAADRGRFEVHLVTGMLPGVDGGTDFDPGLPRDHVRVHLVSSLKRRLDPLSDLRALGDLVRLFRRERFDLVHTHLSKSGVLGRLAARLAGVPAVVHTQHGWNFYYAPNPLLQASIRIVERLAANWADRLCFVCEHDRRLAITDFGLDPSRFADGRRGVRLPELPSAHRRAEARRELGLPPGTPVYGTIIRLYPEKHGDVFLRAAAAVAARHPEAHGILVGSGPEERRLQALAGELGLGGTVTFHPARTDVDRVFAALDVFVHTGVYEGLPGIVLKAMAAGLPVVAVAAAGTGEVVRDGETGVLVPIGDLPALASGLVALLADPARRADLGAAGRRLVAAEYDEASRVRAFETLYLELLASPEVAARATSR